MPLNVAPIVAEYLEAERAKDARRLSLCFAGNGAVHDEGKDRRGLAAIRDWMEETTRKYRPTVVVLNSVEAAASTTATVRVSGTFPGSPIDIRYRLTLKSGKIVRLEIH